MQVEIFPSRTLFNFDDLSRLTRRYVEDKWPQLALLWYLEQAEDARDDGNVDRQAQLLDLYIRALQYLRGTRLPRSRRSDGWAGLNLRPYRRWPVEP